MLFLTVPFLVPFFAGAFCMVLGTFTLFMKGAQATRRYFFATCAIIFVWSLSASISYVPNFTAYSIWNVHWLIGVWIMPIFVLTMRNFPEARSVVSLRLHAFVWGVTAVLAVLFLAFPSSFFEAYIVRSGELPEVITGPFAWIFEIYFSAYVVLALYYVWRTMQKTFGRMRAQILAGWIGLAIGSTGGGITNVIMPITFGREIVWLGPVFVAIAVTSFGYMLLGLREERTRLFPIAVLSGTAIFGLIIQMVVLRTNAGIVIFDGAILASILLLTIFIVRDVMLEGADRQHLEAISDELQHTNEELIRGDRLKSEFLAIVSHHLRTPLTQIKWALTELLNGDYTEEERHRLIEELLQNNERSVRFIYSLLDTSRIEAGKMDIERAPVDLPDLVRSVVEGFRREAESYRRVRLHVDIADEHIPPIMGDATLLRRAFENIVDNAIIYNHPEGDVFVIMSASKEAVEVEVKDTGIGISKKELARIGEKFFRSPSARTYVAEGTGVGVFIAENILQEHGGSLSIDSAKGEGTTVRVRIPFKYLDKNGNWSDDKLGKEE